MKVYLMEVYMHESILDGGIHVPTSYVLTRAREVWELVGGSHVCVCVYVCVQACLQLPAGTAILQVREDLDLYLIYCHSHNI
jgi:hypothetical protein